MFKTIGNGFGAAYQFGANQVNKAGRYCGIKPAPYVWGGKKGVALAGLMAVAEVSFTKDTLHCIRMASLTGRFTWGLAAGVGTASLVLIALLAANHLYHMYTNRN